MINRCVFLFLFCCLSGLNAFAEWPTVIYVDGWGDQPFYDGSGTYGFTHDLDGVWTRGADQKSLPAYYHESNGVILQHRVGTSAYVFYMTKSRLVGPSADTLGIDEAAMFGPWSVRNSNEWPPPFSGPAMPPILFSPPSGGGDPDETSITNNYWTSNAVYTVTNSLVVVTNQLGDIYQTLVISNSSGSFDSLSSMTALIQQGIVGGGNIGTDFEEVGVGTFEFGGQLYYSDGGSFADGAGDVLVQPIAATMSAAANYSMQSASSLSSIDDNISTIATNSLLVQQFLASFSNLSFDVGVDLGDVSLVDDSVAAGVENSNLVTKAKFFASQSDGFDFAEIEDNVTNMQANVYGLEAMHDEADSNQVTLKEVLQSFEDMLDPSTYLPPIGTSATYEVGEVSFLEGDTPDEPYVLILDWDVFSMYTVLLRAGLLIGEVMVTVGSAGTMIRWALS